MRLMYANEIREYSSGDPVYNEMTYQTDILVYEEVGGAIHKPRVVIETKVESITTHDAITYSQKAATHKAVHPYLRYGIFLGKRDHYPLPGRLFRHGAQFDFMLSWSGYESSKEEWKALVGIIEAEVTASRNLEEMIFNSRSKQRKSYTILHKPLYVS
tara:strand:- start:174 stop:647 length:474 start_codon:yes stop_codon:yes gene_type:complete